MDSIPDTVIHDAKRSLLNWLGVAIGAIRHPTIEIALKTVQDSAGQPAAAVLGRPERLDIINAAFINGVSSHVFDFDDTHLRTIIHPSGPVAPALLALSEVQTVSGAELLHAFILGVEIECRIGNAIYPSHYDVGWHITGTAGVFGAAAAVGKLLGLDSDVLTQALGVAASQAGGTREMFGTMTKPFHVGNAARNGLLAARLAGNGFTSSMQPLEAQRGYAYTAATERNLDELTVNLGETYEISVNTFKPFACGIVIHPVIDACVQLRNRHGLTAQDIRSVAVRANPLVLELTGKRTPAVGLEGKFSVFHSAAVAFIHGKAGEEEYSDAAVRDGTVTKLRDSVEVTISPDVRTDEAFVSVTTTDGTVYEIHVEHAIGSLARPMTDGDLETKFRDVTTGVIDTATADRLIELCWTLDSLPDAALLNRVSQGQSA